MPRKPRVNLPGIPLHVMRCGNHREPRFFSEAVRVTRVDAPGRYRWTSYSCNAPDQPEELAPKHEAYRVPGRSRMATEDTEDTDTFVEYSVFFPGFHGQ